MPTPPARAGGVGGWGGGCLSLLHARSATSQRAQPALPPACVCVYVCGSERGAELTGWRVLRMRRRGHVPLSLLPRRLWCLVLHHQQQNNPSARRQDGHLHLCPTVPRKQRPGPRRSDRHNQAGVRLCRWHAARERRLDRLRMDPCQRREHGYDARHASSRPLQ